MTGPTATYPSFVKTHAVWLIGLAIVVSIFAVYGQVKNFEFIYFDDNLYVAGNPKVKNGFSVNSVQWAFMFKSRGYQTYWHPLTWLSHMLDCQLFGLNAGWHHLMNLFFHTANSLLLFSVLLVMTGRKWQSAFAVALFALHPVNVESVAWVAARKNLLSTFFWLLTMLSYAHYVKAPNRARYLGMVVVFVMGLMSKPMLVTLPFVLLLLDCWPFERIQRVSFTDSSGDRRLDVPAGSVPKVSIYGAIAEKIPLLVLSGMVVALSSITLSSFKTMVAVDRVPMLLRVSNALVTYVKYAAKLIFPRKLSILYLFPEHIAWWKVAASAVILAGITFMVIRKMNKRPCLALGWFWYLGTLVPVIGLVQAGMWPEMADRWAYVPFIGLFLMAAWGFGELSVVLRMNRLVQSILAGIVLILFAMSTWVQLGHWQNSSRVLEQSLHVDPQNMIAHVAYGAELEELGREAEAIQHYQRALEISPGFAGAHINLGRVLAGKGNIEKAAAHFEQALKWSPDNADAHFNMGKAYGRLGDLDAAIGHYAEAIRLAPAFIEAYNNLANALFVQGKPKDAVRVYEDALKIEPENALIQNNLAKLLECISGRGCQ